MIAAADRPDHRRAKLLSVAADGSMRELPRDRIAGLFGPADVIVANDAATLPASLSGTHLGEPIEVRLAGWVSPGDATKFVALAFGAGDHRIRTEDRPLPPFLSRGDRLQLGPLVAVVERTLGHPRLVRLRFLGNDAAVVAGLARHGGPIQYAHVPQRLAMWDVWTGIAAQPAAFEPPSAGFALDWGTLRTWRERGVGFATLTHAAGISSTGDPALDARLPFDEPYRIPARTAAMIAETRTTGGRVVAIGTTVVRALESAASAGANVSSGDGIAVGRIGSSTALRVVDAVLTGVHQPGESHFELLRAFADDALLAHISAVFTAGDFRAHEFGDSLLLERQPSAGRRRLPGAVGGEVAKSANLVTAPARVEEVRS